MLQFHRAFGLQLARIKASDAKEAEADTSPERKRALARRRAAWRGLSRRRRPARRPAELRKAERFSRMITSPSSDRLSASYRDRYDWRSNYCSGD